MQTADSEDAIALLRKAADRQNLAGQNEVDIPAREMLSDLLMLEKRPQEAIVEYRIALTLSPKRLNGLLSAGEAEEGVGNKPEAERYYAVAAINTHAGGGQSAARLAACGQLCAEGRAS